MHRHMTRLQKLFLQIKLIGGSLLEKNLVVLEGNVIIVGVAEVV